MTDKELILLRQAVTNLGMERSNIHPRNPFTLKGATAELLQEEIARLDPVQAAQWRLDSGRELSLDTLMAERGLIEHTDATRRELFELSPKAATQMITDQQQRDADLLKKWEEDAADMREARTGSREIDETPNFMAGGRAASAGHKQMWEYNQRMGN